MQRGAAAWGRDFALAFCACFLAITYISAPTLFFAVGVRGDLAADMLHGEALSRGEWLTTGHYSRFKFNHPGPFFFYWNLPFEIALEPLVGRLKAWLWGSVTLNALLVAGSAVAFARYLAPQGRAPLSIAIALVAVALMSGDLGVVWLPTRIEAPFLAFLVALMWLAERDLRALAPAVAAMGMLVHGYITMVLLTVPLLVVALVLAWRSARPLPERRQVTRSLAAAALLPALFLWPIMVELARLPGGNFGAILAAFDLPEAQGSAGWGDIQRAVIGVLAPQAVGLALCFVGLLAALWLAPRPAPLNRRLIALVIFGAATCVVTLLANWGTPTPVPLHTMLHMRPVAVLVAATFLGASYLALLATRPAWVIADVSALAVLLSLAFIPSGHGPAKILAGEARRNYAPEPTMDQAAAFIAQSGQAPRLNFADNALWQDVAGMLVWLIDRDHAACTTRRDMAFLFTEQGVCAEGAAPAFEVVRQDECQDRCSFAEGDLGLIPVAKP